MAVADYPTPERIRELLDYDAETGVFTWRAMCGRAKPGQLAGTIDARGIVVIGIDGYDCRAHALAWLLIHGEIPPWNITHLNGKNADNRITNLARAKTDFGELTAERVRELFSYDSENGVLIRRVRCGRIKQGSVAGTSGAMGYIRVCVDGRDYLLHRLVWLAVHGRWPSEGLDHIDGNPSNNRLSNLREATQGENMQNQRMAQRGKNLLGAYKRGSRWTACICVNGRQKHLGQFDTEELAHAAYVAAKRIHHPFGML